MSGSTPVGFLYTPQQLAGSMRFGSGVLLGNWREDDALDEMRMMDHISAKETASLTLHKRQQKLAPQLAPVALTAAPADGVMHVGDTVLLQSGHHGGNVACSLGQTLTAADAIEPDTMFLSSGCSPEMGPCARNAITFVSYDGVATGSPLCYGSKVCLQFGAAGYLASQRSVRSQLSTMIINKQEVYVQAPKAESPPYECAWMLLPVECDERIIANGTPVVAGAPFVLVHCFTNKRLAGVNVPVATDFGSELGLCAHTYTETAKVNKLMRETIGRPTNGLISRNETSENIFGVIYA